MRAPEAQVTHKRIDRAFQAFFRRVRDGEAPLVPAFQGARALQRLGVQDAGQRLATCARRRRSPWSPARGRDGAREDARQAAQ